MTAWSVNALAARALASHAHDAEDLARLLDMLGLIGADGRIAPDDRRYYALRDPGTGSDPMLDNLTRRDPAAQAPAGLAVLDPVASPKPKPSTPRQRKTVAEGRPSRARKPRKVPDCGTDSGFRRHQKRGEPIDDPCREAHRIVHRKYEKDRRDRKRDARLAAGQRSEDEATARAAAAEIGQRVAAEIVSAARAEMGGKNHSTRREQAS